MLLIKTLVKTSPIAGLGLFADEDIKQGEIIWRYDPQTCALFTKEQVDTLLTSAQNAESIRYYLTYGWYVSQLGGIVVCLDNGRFVNHSPESNLGQINAIDDGWRYSFALRDIEKGEELTENYSTYDSSEWFNDLHHNYNIFNTNNIKKAVEALQMMSAAS